MLASAPRSLRIVVQVLLVAIVVGAAYLYAPPVGAVSAEALQHSLARTAGAETSSTDHTCTPTRKSVWYCLVVDSGSPGKPTIQYQLTRHGRRCWDASQVDPGRGHLRQSLSACVGMRDQIRPEQRF